MVVAAVREALFILNHNNIIYNTSRHHKIGMKLQFKKKPVASIPNILPSNNLHRYSYSNTKLSAIAATDHDAITSFDGDGVTQLEVRQIKEKCKTWLWRGQYSINYFVSDSDTDSDGDHQSAPNGNANTPPLLLVHGFGASIPHWRRNIDTLSQKNTVYAIDLLGFGASDKPQGFQYTIEAWAQESRQNLVCGMVLLNCAGGMNNKAIVDDWRIKLLLSLLWLIDFLLKQRVIASAIFERVRQRDTLRGVILSVYGNKEVVDEELVEIIREPANDEKALDAFVLIVTGPPRPNPMTLMPRISIPVLVLWGDQDPLTPLDGPVGKYFSSLPNQLSNVSLRVLEGVGHCPHDDKPKLVHDNLLPWLAQLAAL